MHQIQIKTNGGSDWIQKSEFVKLRTFFVCAQTNHAKIWLAKKGQSLGNADFFLTLVEMYVPHARINSSSIKQ